MCARTDTCIAQSLRQAYDYWQDQPGNCFGVDRPRRAAPPRVCRPRHDALLSISRSSLALAPDGFVFALPAKQTSTSSSIARMPPARAGNADTRDNLVFDCVDSALLGNETSRRPRTARVRLSMATSAVRTSEQRELQSPPFNCLSIRSPGSIFI